MKQESVPKRLAKGLKQWLEVLVGGKKEGSAEGAMPVQGWYCHNRENGSRTFRVPECSESAACLKDREAPFREPPTATSAVGGSLKGASRSFLLIGPLESRCRLSLAMISSISAAQVNFSPFVNVGQNREEEAEDNLLLHDSAAERRWRRKTTGLHGSRGIEFSIRAWPSR
jgi:hypothetical protein